MHDSPPVKGWHLLRITLETLSPLSCATGATGVDDVKLVRDANGLPMIPASTLQGLLRHFWAGVWKIESPTIDELFGNGSEQGASSARLLWGHAHVLNSYDKSVAFPATKFDDLHTALMAEAPLVREHVRLDHRGTAAAEGKFNRVAVPRGARFQFDVMWFGEAADCTWAKTLFAAFDDYPLFRIGARATRGYGRVKVHAAKHKHFLPDAAEDFAKARSGGSMDDLSFDKEHPAKVQSKHITLKPIGPFRFGACGLAQGDSDVNMASTRECWIGGDEQARKLISPATEKKLGYLFPATAISGPLRHRTMYHWLRLNNKVATEATCIQALVKEAEQATSPLFGQVGEKDGDARASALIFDDAPFEVEHVIDVTHNSIDAFTGGTIQSKLYSEQLLLMAPNSHFEVSIHLNQRQLAANLGHHNNDQTLRDAFDCAVKDLCTGQLALGAKSYGFMTGNAEGDFWRLSEETPA
ncbi:MAG: hypothetical protein RLZZ157_16 [Pseudomonadota bacterium]|jgi:CRISPR/Cas system CSM-associated protein Csm3 (group 7 of RAMP superfamily)